jgi:ribonuclease PH
MATARRHDGRRPGDLRPVKMTPGYVSTADGSCLIQVGGTQVICTASLTEGVPEWLEGSGRGWVTAEYGMLPASTGQRKRRPLGRPDGRSAEIQRFIGRVLRTVVAMERLGENTLYLDCDVLTADGGTRTAAVTGAYVALAQATARAAKADRAGAGVLVEPVAAVSVGIVDGRAVLDLDYAEDRRSQVDMNVAMIRRGRFVEIQGTSEGEPFDGDQLQAMLRLAKAGIRRLIAAQQEAVGKIKAKQ